MGKKSRSKITIISLFLWNLVTIGVCLYLNTNNLNMLNIKEQESLKGDSLINMAFDMEEIIECIFSNQGYEMSPHLELYMNSMTYKISDLATNTIFVYMSPMSCWSCVKSINNSLTYFSENGNIVFRYLIPHKFSKDIQPFLDYSGIPSDKTFFISSDLGLPIESENRPFLFTLEDSHLIKNVFTPSRYSPELSKVYISNIINHLNN